MDGKDGFLFKPRDAQDLALKVIQALSGAIPLAVLEQKSRKMNSSISWDSIAKGFITSYNQLVMENKK